MSRFLPVFLVVAASAAELPPASVGPVDFVRDVQPIFREHCLSCHGPEKQKSEYRVDVKHIAIRGGDNSAPNIVPGKSAESPLMKYVSGLDEDMLMPPKKSDAKRLTAAQVGVLRRWIDDGAEWPDSASAKVADKKDWWSLKPLATPLYGGPANPVDAFINAKLAEKGLAMSPEADPRTLIRRLYFDLTGLPPSPEEVDAFVAAYRPNMPDRSYEALVDKLLASPRYGERWARHWLDVVHFGETHGYDKDQPRPNAWPYRDYVIRAFNEDKPYARFVQEQVGGDVLFPGTRDGIEALGFISAGPWDFIGHAEVPEEKIDGKIARHLDRDDMVANTVNTFNSLTVHCAQCHDHKFDPISQEDYYSLHAVFAALDRADRKYYADDAMQGRFVELEAARLENERALSAIEEPLRKKAGEAFTALTRRIEGASKAKQGNTNPDFGYHAAISPVQDAVKWVQIDLGEKVSLERVTLLPCYDDFNNIGAGFGFPVRFKIEVSDDAEFRSGVKQFWRDLDRTLMADFPNPKLTPFSTHVAKDDGLAGRYVRVTATKLAPRQNDFILALAEVQVFDTAGKNVAAGKAVTAMDSIEAPPRWRKANLTDGIAPVAATADEKEKLLAEREALLLTGVDDSTKAKRAALLAGQKDIAAKLAALPAPARIYAGTVHSGSGTFKGTGGKPRPIALLARGDVTRPGVAVKAGTIGLRFDVAETAPEGERRAALAHWLTDKNNALTWRSIVNRVWHYHFGRGIVDTPNDFGRMGGVPTHPELLDWLAANFRDEMGGSFKKLHRTIVLSAAYRQSSATDSAKAREVDGNNTLLWRQNRRKLEAEALRDSILAVAGKLDLTMGGPSFQDFKITHPEHSPHYEYHLADMESPALHRRSVYRFIARSQQQPWMASLDCADPSMLVDKRNQTITPLQALAQMNNQLMVVMAKHFAARVEKGGGVEEAFRIAFQRVPTAEEKTALNAYTAKHGLANACRLIVNMNEFAFID
jgi:mono/diheme cytochrome c family protein